MNEICNEINVDTEDRCTLTKGHDGSHLGVTAYGAKTPFYAKNEERRELQSALSAAEKSALELAKHLRRASLAVSKLFP